MADIRRFFIENSAVCGDRAALAGEEFKHMVQVLRHRAGDRVILLPGTGEELLCEIAEIGKNEAMLCIVERKACACEPLITVDLFQAVCRGEKMELITQKAVELGAHAIYPFTSDFTVAQGGESKLNRLNKIALEAVKQCRRSVCVEFGAVQKLEDVAARLAKYDLAVLCYERETGTSMRSVLTGYKPARVALIVGSEGGFSEREAAALVRSGAVSAGLGRRVLRAETAAIAALSAVMYQYGEWD